MAAREVSAHPMRCEVWRYAGGFCEMDRGVGCGVAALTVQGCRKQAAPAPVQPVVRKVPRVQPDFRVGLCRWEHGDTGARREWIRHGDRGRMCSQNKCRTGMPRLRRLRRRNDGRMRRCCSSRRRSSAKTAAGVGPGDRADGEEAAGGAGGASDSGCAPDLRWDPGKPLRQCSRKSRQDRHETPSGRRLAKIG